MTRLLTADEIADLADIHLVIHGGENGAWVEGEYAFARALEALILDRIGEISGSTEFNTK